MLDRLKGLFSKGKAGVGLELTPDRLNIAQLKKQGAGYKLTTFHSVEVPEGLYQEGQIADPPEMARLIGEVFSENQIKVKKIATAIPGRDAVIRLVPVPEELNDQELRDYMNQEAGLYLPFPREEADVDYQKLGLFVDEDGIEKIQVLLVATRKEVTQTYIDTFQEAGLQIDVLEVTSLALLRSIREQLQQYTSQEAAILTDIEFDSTEISVIVEGIPQFSRTIPIGTFHMQAALSQAMNLPETRDTEMVRSMSIPVGNSTSDSLGLGQGGAGGNPGTAAVLKVLTELGDELRRSIDFYLNQSEGLEVAQMWLAGPGAAIGQLDQYFMERLNVPASQVDPVETLSLDADEEVVSVLQRPGLGVVLGLGLREV